MWIFEGKYYGKAKDFLKAKEKKALYLFFAVCSLFSFLPCGILLASFPQNTPVWLIAELVVLSSFALFCYLFYLLHAPKAEIVIQNDGIDIPCAGGSRHIPFYDIAPVRYGEDYIALKNRILLQKDLLKEGSWEELQDFVKKVEDSLSTDEPVYRIEEPKCEFFSATVVSKRIYKKFVAGTSVKAPVSEFHYFVTFTLPDGKQMEFDVGKELFDGVTEKESGTLTTVNGNFFGVYGGDAVE